MTLHIFDFVTFFVVLYASHKNIRHFGQFDFKILLKHMNEAATKFRNVAHTFIFQKYYL